MKKEITRIDTETNEFCTLEVELRDRNGNGLELSICGYAGYLLDEDTALHEAREYWISFFEENGQEEIDALGERFGQEFGSPEAAADFVLEVDGELHGLDTVDPRNLDVPNPDDYANTVFAMHSCGQIRETIAQFFPEAKPYFRFHLNGLQKVCPCLQQFSAVLQDRLQELGETPEEAQKHADDAVTAFDRCPDCGAKPGSQWWHAELPPAVVRWVEEL